MKQKVCFVFMPDSYTGLENLIPVIVCLNQNNWKVHSIFQHTCMHHFLEISPMFHKILRDNSTIVHLDLRSSEHRVPILKQLIKVVPILGKILFSSCPRIITTEIVSDVLTWLLKLISYLKGKFYFIAQVNAPISFDYHKYYLDIALNDPEKRKILGKKPGRNIVYQTKNYLGKMLLHSDYESNFSDLKGFPKDRVIIGYPKLQTAWIDYIRKETIKWDNPLLESEESFVVMLLKKPELYYFEDNQKCEQYMKEIITSIRTHFNESLIVLKPKPFKTVGKNSWVDDFVEALGDRRVIVSYTPNPPAMVGSLAMLMTSLAVFVESKFLFLGAML